MPAGAVAGALGIAVAHLVRDGWSASIAVSTFVWLTAAVLGGEALRARRGQASGLVARAEEEQRTTSSATALRSGALRGVAIAGGQSDEIDAQPSPARSSRTASTSG